MARLNEAEEITAQAVGGICRYKTITYFYHIRNKE